MQRITTAGLMRHRVTLQRPVISSDGYGNETNGFEDVATIAAQISENANGVGGAENVQAGKLFGTGYVNITLRKSSDTANVQPEWRVKNTRENHYYNIRQIRNDDERGDFLTLTCQRGVADGETN
jgi:SPP1 family predicted phage head-tail adaptor